jgi:hypothetical protein
MTDRWLVTDPVLPPILLHGIVVALAVFFAWMEWKRNAPHLSVRLIALIIMMLAVAGFLLRPRYETTTSQQIILLTPEYDKSKADSLLNIYPSLKVFHSKDAEPYHNSVAVDSYHDVSPQLEDIIFILGLGLPPEALDLFPSCNYQFIPAPYPNGVIRLSLTEKIIRNRTATIEGVLNNRSENSKFILTGPGGKEDSVSFLKSGLQPFSLSFRPKKAGRFLYMLQSADTIVGKLPVSVQEEQQLNILFIQHYPTFETRYMKDFLARDHSLLVRYKLSKNKFRYESINRKERTINRLTKESLSEFDLLIIDTDALRDLQVSERNNLRSAIEEGLGLLPFFNAQPGSTQDDMVPFTFRTYGADTAHVSLHGSRQFVLPAWPLRPVSESGMTPVLKNKNRILSGYRHQGFGKIGFQLLQETYRLMLQGDSIAYSSLWSNILEKISRSDTKELTIWQQRPTFPLYPDAPVEIEFISSEIKPRVLVNDIEIPLAENILIDDVWMAKFWTDREGWNRIAVAGDTISDLYTSNKNEWRSLAMANALESTRDAAAHGLREKKLSEIFMPVPGWIFYLLFLIAAGFLWLAPKL